MQKWSGGLSVFGRKRRNKSLFNTLKINQLGSKYFFHQVKIILSAQKKLLPCGFALLSAGFLCMDWEQRSLYCNKEAAATYTCCSVFQEATTSFWAAFRDEPTSRAPLCLQTLLLTRATSLILCHCFCFSETLHLIALFWIPTVHW